MIFVCCVRFSLAGACAVCVCVCVCGVKQKEHNSVQGRPSPPNQILLLCIPEGTEETNPKYLGQILSIPAASSYSETTRQQKPGQMLAVMDTRRAFSWKSRQRKEKCQQK